MRRVPGKGIGYGILKYSTPQEKKGGYRFDLDSEIVFNYLGKFGEDMGKINPGSTNRFKLYIEGILQDDRLRFSFTYNKFQYKRESIERLIGYYKSSLLKIIEHCCNKMEKESTPSDLGYSDISIEQLEEFENDLSDID